MTTAVQHRRGTTAEHSTFTGLEGEVTIDTTKDTAVIHDGVLAGGYPLAKETLANVNPSSLTAITGAATASDDLFMVYDASTTSMKKITRAELNNAMEADALANVSITGGTINGTAIGGTTAAAGSFTTLSASGAVTLSAGTANGVAYLNGSKVVTSGSALTFDGSTLATSGLTVNANDATMNDATGEFKLILEGTSAPRQNYIGVTGYDSLVLAADEDNLGTDSDIRFRIDASEKMRLTSTGLGIGTSSPTNALSVSGNANITGNTTLGDASTDTVTVNGYMGVGGAASSSRAIQVSSNALTGTTQIGILSQPTANSAATSELRSIASYPVVEDSAFTIPNVYGFFASVGSKGASATATSWHGVYIADQTQGTNNYGITSLVSSGTNKWNIYASGTAANYFAGNVGIGTSSPSKTLDVNGAATVKQGTAYGWQVLNSGAIRSGSNGVLQISADTGNAYASSAISFDIDGSTKATLDASGNLLVGTTSSNANAGGLQLYNAGGNRGRIDFSNVSGASNIACGFYYGATPTSVGSITTTSTSTTYATSSDYRLKNTIAPMTGALAKVALLKPCTYKWNADGSDGEGFIAHELAEVCPQAVTGEKDAVDADGNPVYQGIDTSFLVATLTAAIQELKAEFDAYKATHP